MLPACDSFQLTWCVNKCFLLCFVSVCRLHGNLDLMHGSCMTAVGLVVGTESTQLQPWLKPCTWMAVAQVTNPFVTLFFSYVVPFSLNFDVCACHSILYCFVWICIFFLNHGHIDESRMEVDGPVWQKLVLCSPQCMSIVIYLSNDSLLPREQCAHSH